MIRAAVVLLALLLLAAAPPAVPTAEQLRLLEERDAAFRRALSARTAGKSAEVVAALEQALTLNVRVNGPYHRYTENRAAELTSWRHGEAALKHHRQLIEVRERLYGSHHWRTKTARANAVMAEADLRRTPADLETLNKALGLNRKVMELLNTGQAARAVPLAREALALRKEVLGERNEVYAGSLNNLAFTLKSIGDHRAAISMHQRALRLIEDVFGEGHPHFALNLNNLAVAYREIRDHDAALPLFERALKLRREHLGEQHIDYAVSLDNLATLLCQMGRPREAVPLRQRAVAAARAAVGERNLDYLICLDNLAATLGHVGDLDAALPLAERAAVLFRQVVGERHPSYATSVNGVGQLYHAKGDDERALARFERAMDLRKRHLGERSSAYAVSLNNMAVHLYRMGRPGAAVVYQEQCLHLTREQLALAAVQPERLHLSRVAARRHRLDWRLSMPEESPAFSHPHVLSWKGAVFAAQEARRAFVRLQGDRATRALADELLDATRELALLSPRRDAKSRARVEELTRIKDDREARLAERSESFRAARTPPTSDAIRQLLPDGVVLVDLLAYNGYDPARPARGQKWQRRAAAWVLRRDRETVRVELGPVGPVESAVTGWRRALEAGEAGADDAARLRRLVWAPLERHAAGAKVVLLSPDGPLSRLPFAALPGSKEGTYLIEEVPLAVLPVPRYLPELLRPAEGKASLLTVGGVDFDAALKGDRRERRPDEAAWPALAGTAAEAAAVAARFKGPKTALAGKGVTRAAMREALTRHRHAHLATHGYFAPASLKSALERADERSDSVFQREALSGLHPGLLSGLVLAGANRPTEEDDGILTALEIAELDLSGLELAVLSACETGLGQEANGEGMLGLQRAFAVAGAKSVVSSLWSVNDAATSVLMERFYHHLWTAKLSKLEALRRAQIEVLRHPEWVEERATKLASTGLAMRGVGKAKAPLPKGRRQSPPAWWAAWQLSGDWR